MATTRSARLLAAARSEPLHRLVFNHLKVETALRAHGAGALTAAVPKTTTRYLRPYLARSLDHIERREIVLLQTRLLTERMGERFFQAISRAQITLWQAGDYAISLSMSNGIHGEGDFELDFLAGGASIYLLSFSFGPVQGSAGEGRNAMLISRLQGARGGLGRIREATRAQRGVAPASLLFAAAEGVAHALKLDLICGVSDAEQLSAGDADKAGCAFCYDAFWLAHGGALCGRWFHFELPLVHKPLAEVTRSHRRRAKARRAFRTSVEHAVREAFLSAFAEPVAG